ncbi:nuclear pore complex protein Nup98-Nup96-like [Littorina saxatilis]|uniref:Nuclear pore complex protein Nup98-Nup96 n=1 Tax=Littorina saxatilis TaxID=31220 RepID=A0AAN9B0Z9_9CAEN
MFGSKLGGFGTTTSSFGTATPFGGGQATTGFGGSAFGAQTPASGGLFGAPSTGTTGGLFGQQAASSFGQQQQQQQPSTGFNFGTPSNTSTASGGLFGQQSSGLFSTPQAGSAFGTKPQGFGGFGTTQTASTGGGGLFGSTTQQPSTGGASLFGQPSGGLFGSTPGTGAAGGTTIKFNPPSGQDTMSKSGVTTNINTRHQCITAMKEYENKSMEELRMEDYTANRKGKQAGTATSFFSQPAPQATQAGNTGFSFGQPAAASTGGFSSFGSGGTVTSTGGLFGGTKPLFGPTATATATTQSGFSFGSAAPAQTGSVFGQAKPLFGTPTSTPQTGGMFGTSQQSAFGTSTAFGASTGFGATGSTGGGLLGSKPMGFGTTTTASTGFGVGGGSLFNKPAASSAFSFGPTGNTGFGGGTTGGSLFGAGKPGGFGAPTGLGAGSSFGTGLGTTGTTGGMFGNPQAKTGFNFNPAGTTGTFSLGGTSTGGLLGGNAATLGTTTSTTSNTAAELQQQLLAVSPYGDSPLFWNLKNQNAGKREEILKPTNPAAQKAVLSSGGYKVSPRPVAKIKPKSLHSLLSGSKGQLFDNLDNEEDLGFGGETFVPRRSVKKLVLKKGGGGGGSIMSRSVSDGRNSPQPVNQNVTPITRQLQQQGQGDDADRGDTITLNRLSDIPPPRNDDHQLRERGSMDDTIESLYPRLPESNTGGNLYPRLPESTDFRGQERDEYDRSRESNHAEQDVTYDGNVTNSNLSNASLDPLPVDGPPHPAGIRLTRPGYYTIPSMDELAHMLDKDGNCLVEELTIGRENYGSVFFYGVINVAGLDLDSIVHFRRKEIVVYPDDSSKPPVGEGLNRRAEVTLNFVWPTDKTTRQTIKDPERLIAMNYQEKLENISSRMNAKFIDYRPETGSWVFEVPHFSKYGLVEEDDEQIEPTEQEKKKLKTLEEQQRAVQKQKIKMFKAKKQAQKGKGVVGMAMAEAGEMGATAMMGEGEEEEDEEGVEMLPDITQEQFPSDMMTETMEDDEQTQPGSLPLRLGVSARNVQLMKASFFTEEMVEGDKESLHEERSPWYRGEGVMLKSGEKAMPSLFNTSLGIKQSLTPRSMSPDPKEMMMREKKSLFQATFGQTTFGRPPPASLHLPPTEHKLISSGLMEDDVPRKIVGLRVQHEVPELSESLVYHKQKVSVDAACFMGRSFRVGWGPGWTLVHAGNPCMSEEEGESNKQSAYSLLPSIGGGQSQSRRKAWTVSLEQLNVSDFFHPADAVIRKSHEQLLEIALANSRVGKEAGCPVAAPAPSTDALHRYADNSAANTVLESHGDAGTQLQMRLVWQLCVALWGNPPELEEDTERGGYTECQARREALSRWLTSAAQTKIQSEVSASAHKTEGHLEGIMAHLSGRQVGEACSLAQDAGDDRLALLLAQAAGSNVPRQMVAVQLAKWAEMGVTEFIREQRQRVFCLLAGLLIWDGPQSVNTCCGMDWKRALALHLWYHCQPNAPIPQALKHYENAFKGTEDTRSYAAPPLPPYLEESAGLDLDLLKDSDVDGSRVLDACYHLLKLFCQKGYPLETILNPTCVTANSLDHRLSWHLQCVLQALDFHHLSPHSRASLHANYASQLESVGLWHWAVFPLLHIHHPTQREHAIRQLLGRHVQLSEKDAYLELERFMVDNLSIPPEWIHDAKATKAHYLREHKEEATHLLEAGRWNEAHQVIVTHLAADAIVNDNHSDLMEFLDVLAAPERSVAILNWNTCGKVFYDFIVLSRHMVILQQSPNEVTPYDLEHLKSEVRSLCGRVRHLPCLCALDRHCQSLMASQAMTMLRTILLHAAATMETGAAATDLLAQTLSGLPLPEDYALQELRDLTRSHLMEVLS